MSLSRPLMKGRRPLHSMECFEAERVDLEERRGGGGEGYVKLPTCKEGRPLCAGRSRMRKGEQGSREEEKLEDRISRLEKESYERGFEQGRKDGLALEKRQMEEKGKQLEALLSGLVGLKAQIYSEAEGELLRLGTLIAKKIIRNEVQTDPRVICRTIQAATEYLVDRSHMKIHIHPEDMEEIREFLPGLSKMTKAGRFEIIEDSSIERGGCILETGFGRVNATVDDQLEAIRKVIDQVFVSGQRSYP